MAVFGQRWLYSVKIGCIQANSSCIWAKVVYSGKNGLIRAKFVVFGQNDCVRAKYFYSEKVVVFGLKWIYSGKSGCIRAKVVLFGQ